MARKAAKSREGLGGAKLCTNVPVADLGRARAFYEGVLGLTVALADDRRGIYFRAASGLLNVYERAASPGDQALATFIVDDLVGEKRRLTDAGVRFEDYGLADLNTVDGVYRDATGFAVAWFKDPDGHLLALEQLPAAL